MDVGVNRTSLSRGRKSANVGGGRWFRRALSVLVMLTLVFAVAACGQGSEESSSGSQSTETEGGSAAGDDEVPTESSPVEVGPGVSEDEIRLGILASTTGPAADVGRDMVDAMQRAADEINSDGGVGGRSLTLVVEDTAADPAQGTSAYERLAGSDVLAIMGVVASGVGLAVTPLAEEDGIPVLVTSGTAEDIVTNESKYTFRSVATGTAEAQSAASLMSDEWEAESYAVLAEATDYGRSWKTALDAAAEESGLEKVADEEYAPDATDFSSQLRAAEAASPDVLAVVAYPRAGALIAEQVQDLGLDFRILGSGGLGAGDFRSLAGDAAVGVTHIMYTVDVVSTEASETTDELHQLVMDYWESRGEDPPSAFPAQPNNVYILAYVGAKVMAAGLEGAGENLTRDGLVKALEDLPPYESNILPPIEFTPENHEGFGEPAFAVYTEDGKAVAGGN